MNSFKSTPDWAMGDEIQKRWAWNMSERGFLIMPVYNLEDVDQERKLTIGARLFHSAGKLIAPDILLLRGGKRFWHEVKAKSQPTWRRCPPGPRWEHGCDLYNANEYRRVEDMSGIPVWIIVHEQNSPLNVSEESELEGPETWLGIHIGKAFEVGDQRPDWPGGKKQPERRGSKGMGGLLWPRNLMNRIVLEDSPAYLLNKTIPDYIGLN